MLDFLLTISLSPPFSEIFLVTVVPQRLTNVLTLTYLLTNIYIYTVSQKSFHL